MISRFFIDRPIFATVLSVVITLIGGIAYFHCRWPSIRGSRRRACRSPSAIPGPVPRWWPTRSRRRSSSRSTASGMLYMSSQSGNDGSYTLTVTFDIGTDLNTALVMVQNRVALAMPQLPTAVQNQGITIRKKTPDILMIVNFYSPTDKYDDIYLSNFATIYVKDELLRVDGVSDITFQGERDYSIRAWLDPQKLAAHSITAMDVANAIRSQNLDAPAGRIGQPPIRSDQSFQLTLDTLGRLSEPEQFGDIIIKVGGQPLVISPLGIPASASSSSSPAASSSSSSQRRFLRQQFVLLRLAQRQISHQRHVVQQRHDLQQHIDQ